MAKQDSIISIKGTIDNLNFYKSKDGYMARKKTSIDASRVASDPAFKRTREVMAEFTNASVAGKLLRAALRPLAKQAKDHRVVSRLQGKFASILRGDKKSKRGQRNVSSGSLTDLVEFEFNKNAPLATSLFAPYDKTIDRVTGELKVAIPAFVPEAMIAAPKDATHFQLHLAGVEANFTEKKLVAKFTKSEQLALGEEEIAALSLSVSLPANSTQPLFMAMGITYFVETNEELYSLQSGSFNALGIIMVSVPA